MGIRSLQSGLVRPSKTGGGGGNPTPRITRRRIASRPCRWQRRRQALLLGLWLALAQPAMAFQTGGHYDTVLSVLSSAAAAPDEEQRSEAFCTELPDLSSDLDAITQRVDVLLHEPSFRWGVQGRCSTPVSQHMVRSQFFLHALTGLDVAQARASAHTLITQISARIERERQAAGQPQALATLVCARGFAFHFLGDTIAHADLHQPSQLYRTGLGHFRDLAVPDYMMRRQASDLPEAARWEGLVRALAQALSGPKGGYRPDSTLALPQHLSPDDRSAPTTSTTEAHLTALLEHALPAAWVQPPLPDGKNWMGLQTRSCAEQAHRSVLRLAPHSGQIPRHPSEHRGASGSSRIHASWTIGARSSTSPSKG